MTSWALVKSVERVGAVYLPPDVAAWPGKPGAWLVIRAGFVLLVHSKALHVDGVLRLDGVVRVSNV